MLWIVGSGPRCVLNGVIASGEADCADAGWTANTIAATAAATATAATTARSGRGLRRGPGPIRPGGALSGAGAEYGSPRIVYLLVIRLMIRVLFLFPLVVGRDDADWTAFSVHPSGSPQSRPRRITDILVRV